MSAAHGLLTSTSRADQQAEGTSQPTLFAARKRLGASASFKRRGNVTDRDVYGPPSLQMVL